MAKLYYGEGKKKQGHRARSRKQLVARAHFLIVYTILAALLALYLTNGR
jgi:hypothetical protein